VNPAPTITLPNGVEMPHIGLGTWPMDDAESAVAVAGALRVGYRLIDTAETRIAMSRLSRA
jgi:2,5-diketo-D-gluconate reductase A